jgi:hypothetical protein
MRVTLIAAGVAFAQRPSNGGLHDVRALPALRLDEPPAA